MVKQIISAHDDAKINVFLYDVPNPKAVIHIIHGFGEGAWHYSDLSNFFVQNNFAAVVHDQRGFGDMSELSTKEKRRLQGVIPGYDYFLADIKTVYALITQRYPKIPVVLYGHSMGGNIAISHLVQFPAENYSKLILESPWLRLYSPVQVIATRFVAVLSKIFPNFTISTGLDPANIARNREKTSALNSDGIYHGRISLKMFTEITQAGELAIKNAKKITLPTLLLCAGQDKIVCPNAIKEFAAAANSNVQLIEYPDGYHNLHLDSIADKMLTDVVNFVLT
ncbi:MAG: lysophospholipase [Firmicutes bacterium]|nr:lysophospholipase [Bacillota bacterium]